MKPRVYDCFCYFNEDMILELRFETLWDYVDYFVISEAVYTQTGVPKALNFKIDKFYKYRDKIRYLVVDHYPPGEPNFWKNENYQRNYLINGLYDARDEDRILISDLDEIPRPETIAQYNPNKYKRGDFQQRAYAYRLNNLYVTNEGLPSFWYGSKITTFFYLKQFFKQTTAVRSYKSYGLLRAIKRTWFKKYHVQCIENGGWHFTWMLSLEKLILKMESIAEQQHNRPEFKEPGYIQHQIDAGLDVLNPHSQYQVRSVESPEFPEYLVNHREVYQNWFR